MVEEDAFLPKTEGHDIADIFGLCNDLGADIRFFDAIDPGWVRHLRWVVDDDHLLLIRVSDKAYVGHRGDDGLVELAFQPLMDDLHMEHAEETATKAKAKGLRGLQLVGERSVVQLQLVHAISQLFKIVRVNREDARKDHRLYFLETLDHLPGRIGGRGEGVPYLYFFRVFDPGNDIPYVTRPSLRFGGQGQFEYAHLVGLIGLIGGDELHLIAFFQRAIKHAIVDDDPAEGVEDAVE